MNLKSGLSLVSTADMDGIAQVAVRKEYLLYRISTEGRSGREAFFDAIATDLPLDPPVHGSRSWDALSDSLWEGLHSRNYDCIVILWPDASTMAEESPDDFDTAISVLADVARLLADANATVGRTTDVCIYVGRR
jgi:Barstar (barnase inhibitor)